MFSHEIDNRMTDYGSDRYAELAPFVVLKYGAYEVFAWEVPEPDRGRIYYKTQDYTEADGQTVWGELRYPEVEEFIAARLGELFANLHKPPNTDR